ncbi:MAG TPA: aminotransferase class III-fold pyridoxal phosphate-dependent enzyme [Planctomycetota bacterium]|nr:aminotransferase class III-fold pyridoxal phosphate-dependent enzyme [Planctomycetota bacterium]
MKVQSAPTHPAVTTPNLETRPALVARPEVIAAASAAIEKEFAKLCPQSLLLHSRASNVFPGGVTHDNRCVGAPSHFIRRAEGAIKWDQDGHRYVDYWVGHGALLLGHRRREVLEAIHLAAQDITHPGACHEREVVWAELIQQMIPTAERVRFTASGSEASALAVRLARAMTKKEVIIKFEGHFHGWLDHAVNGIDLPFETPWSSGVPGCVRDLTLVLPTDLKVVEAVLDERDDIAGIILEPTGASGGSVPLRSDFLRGLRDLASRNGVALIFDEVITGFRLAPGGAQERFNVQPDLTCLAKVLAGGMPGGAVCGSREAFAAMEFSGDAKKDRTRRVAQYGTFNASPVCAAAGIATLSLIQGGEPCKRAEAFATKLRNGLNHLFEHENLDWAAYGVSSVFHILTSDAAAAQKIRDGQLQPADVSAKVLKQKGTLDGLLRRALLLEGVDLPPGRQAWVSAAHGNGELSETLDAFARAIARLRELRVI